MVGYQLYSHTAKIGSNLEAQRNLVSIVKSQYSSYGSIQERLDKVLFIPMEDSKAVSVNTLSKSSDHSDASGNIPRSESKPALVDTGDTKSSAARRKLRTVKHKAKRRAKNLLGLPHSPRSSDDEPDEDERDLQTVTNDPAFHPTQVGRRLDISHTNTEGGVAKTKAAFDIAATAIAHPRKTVVNRVKRSAANKIGTSAQGPAAAQTADLAFLEYERALARSGSSRSSSSIVSDLDSSEEADAVAAKSRLLEEQRDSVRAAWITAKTRRVRVVPKGHLPFPCKKSFEERDESENVIRVDWLKWIGNVCFVVTTKVLGGTDHT